MRTVEKILADTYGSEAAAAERLGVVRSAISNWKSWGHFPARLLPQIIADASDVGVDLPIAEIPTILTKREKAA